MIAVLNNPNQSRLFITTCWKTVFEAATPQNDTARDVLVNLYWFPLYAFARRSGASPEDSADAVQSLWIRLLSDGRLGMLNEEGGRFRNYLLVSLKNLVLSKRRAEESSLRSPPQGFVSIDTLNAESRLVREVRDDRSPEQIYDRLCALSLLDSALKLLEDEYVALAEAAYSRTLFPFSKATTQA